MHLSYPIFSFVYIGSRWQHCKKGEKKGIADYLIAMQDVCKGDLQQILQSLMQFNS